MTSSLIRGRPRRARSHISARVVHAVLGGAVAVAWLVLPGMTSGADDPVATGGPGSGPAAGARATAQEDEETSVADLALPLVTVATVGALAGYGYVRRTRRARTRTTPGGAPVAASTLAGVPPLVELDDRSRALLTDADNWIRASREELAFAEARFGTEATAPFARAVQDARAELTAAFRIRLRYDAADPYDTGGGYEPGVPTDEASRRQALAGIVGRCEEVGRRLDAEAPAFARLRALEREIDEASAVAEARFRELTRRTATTEATLTGLGVRYAPSATAPVTGYVEQAKDRLVLATTHLNQARQYAGLGGSENAARHLRTAEGAIEQAAVFLTGVDRLAAELGTAAGMVPAALTGAEWELSAVRAALSAAGEGGWPSEAVPDAPVGETWARIRHADAVLASVRQELTGGRPYDPLDVLHRVTVALAPVTVGPGLAGVLPAAAHLTAHSATASAEAFVATHLGTVGATARTHLAAAQALLGTPDPLPAHTLAHQALDLAEQDTRLHGHPAPDPPAPTTFGGPRSHTHPPPPPP